MSEKLGVYYKEFQAMNSTNIGTFALGAINITNGAILKIGGLLSSLAGSPFTIHHIFFMDSYKGTDSISIYADDTT